jgi:sarcosine oxidase delta subunit
MNECKSLENAGLHSFINLNQIFMKKLILLFAVVLPAFLFSQRYELRVNCPGKPQATQGNFYIVYVDNANASVVYIGDAQTAPAYGICPACPYRDSTQVMINNQAKNDMVTVNASDWRGYLYARKNQTKTFTDGTKVPETSYLFLTFDKNLYTLGSAATVVAQLARKETYTRQGKTYELSSVFDAWIVK